MIADPSPRDGADAALGGDPAGVFVPHPVQDRTDDEMRAMADAAVKAVLATLEA